MNIRAFQVSLAVLIAAFMLPLNASANSFAQFQNSRLFCVVVAGGTNFYASIPVTGAARTLTVARVLNESVSQNRKVKRQLASFQQSIKTANRANKAKLTKKIKAAKAAINLLTDLIAFSKKCRDHELDSTASPFTPGGGGGKK